MMISRTAAALLALSGLFAADPAAAQTSFSVSFDRAVASGPIDGRVLLMLAKDGEREPRLQVTAGINAIQVFGVDANGLRSGETVTFDNSVFGYPFDSLADLPDGEYVAQALLHRYETFNLSNGKTVKLPMDRGEGQQWRRAPGNL